jgi:hypothetical protein
MSIPRRQWKEKPRLSLPPAAELIAALGGDPKTGRCCCPAHGGDNPTTLSIREANGITLLHCFAGCPFEAIRDALRERGLLSETPRSSDGADGAPRRSTEDRRAYALKIVEDTRKQRGEALAPESLGPYFASRGLKTVPTNALFAVTYNLDPNGETRLIPEDFAMVFEVTDGKEVIGTHVTWLNSERTGKREQKPQRQFFGPIGGGYIPFGQSDLSRPLLVGEGVETVSAAVQLTGMGGNPPLPGLSGLDAGNLKKINPPDCSEIIILADHGEAGQEGAYAAGLRWHRAGRKVRIATPERLAGPRKDKPGYDWNDALLDCQAPGMDALLREAILGAPLFIPRSADRGQDAIRELAKKKRKSKNPVEYEEGRTKISKEFGVRKTVIDRQVEDILAAEEKAEAEAVAPPPPTIEELAERAKDIIAADDVLKLFGASIARTLAGEDRSAKLLYLAATSRLFEKPMHVAIKGSSAIGKSYLREQVFAYIPPEDIQHFTTMTERALLYLDGESLAHRILSMAEAVSTKQTELQDYLLREIISNGRIEHLVAVGGGSGQLATTERIVVEGPIMFVTTTTRVRLHPEIETRILSIETDDTEIQTRQVLRKIAELESGGATAAPDLAPWLDFQRWLAAGERRVVVPYLPALANHVDLWIKGIRMRRDFLQIAQAIAAHALLHRDRRPRDDQGRIVATTDDYAVIYDLMADRLAEGAGVALKPNDRKVLDAIEDVAARQKADEGLEDDKKGIRQQGVTSRDLVDELDLDQTTINRRLGKLVSAGLLENLTPGKGRTGHYRASGRLKDRDVLPAPEDLLDPSLQREPKQAKKEKP